MSRASMKRLPPEEPDPTEIFDEEIQEEVRRLFDKSRAYAPPPGGEWRLPDASVALRDPAWTHAPLQGLKESLNEVKGRLSDKDLAVWHRHTCSTNRAGTVTARLRDLANAELCTQAWAKFYEILGTFAVLPEGALRGGGLDSVHLCEAPGAFVAALNHRLRTGRARCEWNWVANTLNPYHEANGRGRTVADDRLIAGTPRRWFFGSDDTGDVMLRKHLLELRHLVTGGGAGTAHLVTADGSFDCQGDPGEQESLVAPLQYCETACALLLLAPGGSFVLKMFTLLEHSSVCLLFLLACSFRQVHVFKPATSKAGNSEVYVVCLGFGAGEALRPLLAKLIRNYGPELGAREALFPKRCVPRSFLEQHEEICGFFHALQVGTIRENLRLFSEGVTREQRHRLDLLRDCAASFYVHRFRVRFLPRKRWLCPGGAANRANPGPRKQTGSFNERRELQWEEWGRRLARGPYRNWVEEHLRAEDCEGPELSGPFLGCDVDSWDVLEGAALPKVCSSVFCDPELLDLLNEALGERPAFREEPESCGLCVSPHPRSVLHELCGLPGAPCCLVVSDDPDWRDAACSCPALDVRFAPGPPSSSSPAGTCALHDGDPRDHLGLFSGLVPALQDLPEGSALVVPLRSALTRFTASLVLALHTSFRSVAFRCPAGATPAVLLCAGFRPAPRVHAVLTEVLDRLRLVPVGRQVLHFAPVRDLMGGDLPHFLCSLNNAVIRRQLHLRLQKKPGG